MGHFVTHELPSNNNEVRLTATPRRIMINITSVLVVVAFPFEVVARIMALITHSNKACYK